MKIGWHFIEVVQDLWNISKIYVHLTGKQFGSSDELSIIKKRHKAIYMVMDLKTYYKFLTSFLKRQSLMILTIHPVYKQIQHTGHLGLFYIY